jgi:hypothetical protein
MKLPDPGFSGSEDDHQFRSHFIRWLLHNPSDAPPRKQAAAIAIPKVLVQYWHDLAAVPADVQECIASWDSLHDEGFKRLLFDDGKARAFIRSHFTAAHIEAFHRCYHLAMRCDYFRLCYILRCGGFYVDADEIYQRSGCEALLKDDKLKLQPLCYDIESEAMVPPEAFWSDLTSTSGRIFYVNNNPLIGPPDHELIRCALERSTRILLEQGDRPAIQETTGPGNLSASLVKHAMATKLAGVDWDFEILPSWDRTSVCRWQLSYRNDERNWRLMGRYTGSRHRRYRGWGK